ncbi:unnamed protein product [Lactuca saligna]|uniref:Uncharacterized protein n=1 Tax=Lactuca saligna TaxID=75948 RepID=A0AA36DX33_LACSI|nr:unnamed protein product [Lactuca saligna]
MDVVADATTRLIEGIITFNKDYLNDLQVKQKTNEFFFLKVEECLSDMKEVELDPIRNLVLRLPTNAPHPVYVSHGGDRGVGSLNVSEEDIGFGVGKVISTQIPTTIMMKIIVSTSTTRIDTQKESSNKRSLD